MKSPTQAYAERPHLKTLTICFIAMMVFAVLAPVMTDGGTALTGEGNLLRQLGYLAIAAVSIFAVRPTRNPKALLTVPLPITAALLICALSLSWAVDPAIGMRRLFLSSLVIWIICTSVSKLSFTQITTILRFILAIVLLVNFAAVFLFPEIGTHIFNEREDLALLGDWRGIMMHKNFAGAISAVTVLLFLFDADNVPKPIRWAVAAAATVFLVFSESKTSLGMLCAGVVIGFIFMRYKSRYRPVLILLLCVGALAAMAWVNFYARLAFNEVMNDRNMFTGRSYIWQTLANYLGDHWQTGAGYGCFWNIGPSSPIYQYGKGWVLDITSGHNGFVDLAVQVGIPATAVIILLMVVWPLLRLLLSVDVSGPRPALLLALLIFCIGHNMTESSLLERDIITEVFLILTIALIWKITSEKGRATTRTVAAGRSVGATMGQADAPTSRMPRSTPIKT